MSLHPLSPSEIYYGPYKRRAAEEGLTVLSFEEFWVVFTHRFPGSVQWVTDFNDGGHPIDDKATLVGFRSDDVALAKLINDKGWFTRAGKRAVLEAVIETQRSLGDSIRENVVPRDRSDQP